MAGLRARRPTFARAFLLSLSVLAGSRLEAQESSVPAADPPSTPSISATLYPYSLPGAAAPSGEETARLALDMRLDLRGIEDPVRDLESVKVFWSSYGDRYFWTVEPESFVQRADGSFRSAKAYSDSALSSVPEAVLPLGPFLIEAVLASGSALRSVVRIASPGETAPGDAEFLYSSSYRDLVSPWHVSALSVPRVISASVDGDAFTLEFAIDDSRAANAELFFCAAGDRILAKTTKLVNNATGSSRPFLNAGLPLRTDGRTNAVSLSLASFALPPGYGRGDIASVYVVAYDGLKFRGSGTPDEYRHYAISRKAAIVPPAAPAPPEAAAGNTVSHNVSSSAPKRPSPLEPDDAYYGWLAALSGIPSRAASLPASGLHPLPLTADRMEDAAAALRSPYGIRDREDLGEAVSRLLEGSLAASWHRCASAIDSAPGLADGELLELPGNEDLSASRLALARRYKDESWSRGLRARELGLAAMLARWSFAAGIVDARGAWELLARIGAEAAPLYDSWEDYGKDCIVGLLFEAESAELGLPLFREAQAAYVALLGPGGEWSSIGWSTGRERGP